MNYDYCYTSSRAETCPCVIIILFYMLPPSGNILYTLFSFASFLLSIHNATHICVGVCAWKKSFPYSILRWGKRFFNFSFFVSSKIRKESTREETKSWVFFLLPSQHKTLRFKIEFNPLRLCSKTLHNPKSGDRNNEKLCCPLNFFFSIQKFLHGFKYGPGRGKKYGTQLNRPKTRSRLTWMLSKREGEEKREKFFFTTLLCFPSTNTHANKNFLCRPTAGRERNEHSKHPPKGCLVLHGDFSRENSYTHTRTNLSLSLDSENSLSHFFPYKFFLFCFQTKDYFSSFPTIIAHFTESR